MYDFQRQVITSLAASIWISRNSHTRGRVEVGWGGETKPPWKIIPPCCEEAQASHVWKPGKKKNIQPTSFLLASTPGRIYEHEEVSR
jgi:hypothetical protein